MLDSVLEFFLRLIGNAVGMTIMTFIILNAWLLIAPPVTSAKKRKVFWLIVGVMSLISTIAEYIW